MKFNKTKSELLDKIAEYTARGWAVFPLVANTKTPATTNGFKDATTDQNQIKQWFSAAHNIGIATGKGLLVLDIDRKHGKDGGEVLASIERENGKLPATLTATTPSGGEHLYYSYPVDVAIQSRANICKEHGEGLDIRADGGYIVAPPSHTEASADPKGKTATGDYAWSNTLPVAELPAEWLELLRTKERTRPAPEPRTYTPDSDRMVELQDAMTYIPAGDYDTWVSVGKALYSLGDSGFNLWDTWSRNSDKYDGRVMPQKWQSFGSGATYEPAFIFSQAQQNGWQNPAKKTRTNHTDSQHQGQPKMDSTENATKTPADIINDAITQLATDPGAVYEPDVLAAFSRLGMADYARLRAQLKASKKVSLRDFDAAVKGSSGQDSQPQDDQSIAAQIVGFVRDRAELFLNQDNDAFARISTGNHRETWNLSSKGFSEWIAAELYRAAGVLPKTDPIKDAVNTLTGLAKFGAEEGEEIIKRDVYLRAGVTDAGAYVIDLCNDNWQSIIVEPGRWYLDTEQTVPFRRATTNKPLPVPLAAGAGNVDALWKFLNVTESDRNMLIAWMLECFRADTAYPVLELSAEQGSGKSSAQKAIRELIDPNAANLRGKPKATEDVYVAAYHSLMVSYENLSHLTDDMQDAFCILSTGGGVAGRKLHTNYEESVMSAKCPIIINGIGTLATRQDLVDRLISVELLPFADNARKTDTELKAMFEECRAEIFTGLLDLFAKALEILPRMKISNLPRMADFALFGAAVYAARGVENPEAAFMADYSEMRNEAISRTLDSSPVAAAIIAYLDKHPDGAEFGTAKAALDELSEFKTDGESWPRSAKGFAEALKRLAPAFRQLGIRAENGKVRSKHGYPVIIKPIKKRDEPCDVVRPDFRQTKAAVML